MQLGHDRISCMFRINCMLKINMQPDPRETFVGGGRAIRSKRFAYKKRKKYIELLLQMVTMYT